MKTIWKYPLEVVDLQTVKMPAGAQILTAQMQGSASTGVTLCLWALVQPDAPLTGCVIEILGTGHPAPDVPRRHIGTVLMMQGALVWHVFERL